MKEYDKEHIAFINFAEENGLDLAMHPLHLLYLNKKTQEFSKAFKAGYSVRQTWISVEDQQPEKDMCVDAWVVTNDGEGRIPNMFFDGDKFWWQWDKDGEKHVIDKCFVKFWRPLPESPNER